MGQKRKRVKELDLGLDSGVSWCLFADGRALADCVDWNWDWNEKKRAEFGEESQG